MVSPVNLSVNLLEAASETKSLEKVFPSSLSQYNKNTLTRLANCKKKQLKIVPTYHYVQNQGKLTLQNRESG